VVVPPAEDQEVILRLPEGVGVGRAGVGVGTVIGVGVGVAVVLSVGAENRRRLDSPQELRNR